MKKFDKKHELKRISTKPVQTFIQYDCFINLDHEDDVMRRDDDGDSLWKSVTQEFRNSDCLRVQLLPNTKKEDAIRGLRKIIEWIKKDTTRCYVEDCFNNITEEEKNRQTGNVYLCDIHLKEHYKNNSKKRIFRTKMFLVVPNACVSCGNDAEVHVTSNRNGEIFSFCEECSKSLGAELLEAQKLLKEIGTTIPGYGQL